MKGKKRLVAVLLLITIIFSGCAGGGAGKGTKNTSITVWNYYSGTQMEAFDELVSEFNKTVGIDQGIVVWAESKGGVEELTEAMEDSAQGKVGSAELPDIFSAYVDTAYTLYKDDMLVNISKYLSEDDLEGYVEGFVAEGMLAPEELYVMPIAKSTELLYLNKTDWEVFAKETDASMADFETWEALAKMAEQYYTWSDGKALFGRDAFANYLIVGSYQLGKEIFKVDNGEVDVQLDEAVMRKLWDNYAVPYIKGHYGAFGRFRSDDVKTGDLLVCAASTTSVSYYSNNITIEDGSTYPIEMEVLSFPNFEGTEPCDVQQGAGMAIVNSGDKEKEKAAVEFLKWFTDTEQNLDFCVKSGYMPVKKEANDESHINDAIDNAGMTEPLIRENALISGKTAETTEFYTTPPFEKGGAFRGVLNKYMSEKLDGYKEAYDSMYEGMNEGAEAQAEETMEEFYQLWISGLESELK